MTQGLERCSNLSWPYTLNFTVHFLPAFQVSKYSSLPALQDSDSNFQKWSYMWYMICQTMLPRVVSKLQFQGFQRFEPSKVAGLAKLAIAQARTQRSSPRRGWWCAGGANPVASIDQGDPFGNRDFAVSCCCKPWIIWICVLDLAQFLTRTASFSTMAATAQSASQFLAIRGGGAWLKGRPRFQWCPDGL